ncbi:GSCFA domain-containing protein [Frigidibacter sp. MR17.24]|uniref:GSCFA domain-containing protein n=1 Tax=Frigidibacter sp. MR17.24 TaxID=3127345 RepID=UPI003012ACEE
MDHPYASLPPTAFWSTGTAGADPGAMHAIHRPAVRIGPATRVATAGSCFAQHIGRALRASGVAVLDAEPAPAFAVPLSEERLRAFGYGLYSGRYGNIYTARQMLQLLQEIAGGEPRTEVWMRGSRAHDALRPNVEPWGLSHAREVMALRRAHLHALAAMLAECEVFVFTLGLTEAWENRETGLVYPVAPGVIAGSYDPDLHGFRNFRQAEVRADLEAILALLQGFRPGMAMIVTVSPVSLSATASGEHVLTATTRSKAVLRAAAGGFAAAHPGAVDYFPSFEIVTNPAARGAFFAPGAREVRPEGVAAVMSVFLAAQGLTEAPPAASPAAAPGSHDGDEEDGGEDRVVCEEMLLDAFRR